MSVEVYIKNIINTSAIREIAASPACNTAIPHTVAYCGLYSAQKHSCKANTTFQIVALHICLLDIL